MRRTAKKQRPVTKLVFATDIHGSDRCFRKFINAGRFYGADHLILGGDITGKVLVAIERRRDGYACNYNDRDYERMGEAELGELKRAIRENGQYPVVGEMDELQALHQEDAKDEAFRTAIVKSIEDWVALAEDRLRGTGIRCFITPGNDDFFEIDPPLQGSDVVEFVEGQAVRIGDVHEMVTTGYSNITPWHSPRELPEDELEVRIEAMMNRVEDPATTVVVAHPPPADTELDQAPAIDAEFRVQMSGGAPKMTSVGSTAVRHIVERYQPLLGLHGHVHESKAAQHIGRTLCINPGSEYTNGTLLCAIVNLYSDRADYQLIAG